MEIPVYIKHGSEKVLLDVYEEAINLKSDVDALLKSKHMTAEKEHAFAMIMGQEFKLFTDGGAK